MREYEIFFYPSIEVKGIHVFRCKAEDCNLAYVYWSDTFPNGLAWSHKEGWTNKVEGVILHYYDPEKVVPERKPNFRDKLEARKANKK